MASAIVPTYARADVTFDHGEGAWLTTVQGERYLDFGAGIAVVSLGHSHPHLLEALNRQGGKLWHTSNLFQMPEGEKLARRLADASFADLVFFANSGAEANEAAIKMARRRQYVDGHPERFHILTFEGAFHGRTLATIAAGGQAKYLEGFGPKVEGFDQIPITDLAAVEAAVTDATAAIMIEPVQGEGGVRPVPTPFLRGLREICDRRGILLIFDEVQTGVGRSGKLFDYEVVGVTPDILTSAKGLGGGFPIAACLATAAILIEPVQGEGGVRPVPTPFLRGLREICDRRGILLIFDEVQTGVGRSGKLFDYEVVGVTPDILTSAKGLGGGFPIAACLATADAARGLTTGVHGTTFGGNPLAMAIGNAVLDVVLAPGFLENVERLGINAKQKLAGLKDAHPKVIEEVRGVGLMLGLKLKMPPGEFAALLRDEHMLTIPAGDNTLRLLPPLTITDAELDEAVHRLDKACVRAEAEMAKAAA